MKLLHRLLGKKAEPSFPFFIEKPVRALTDNERSVVARLLHDVQGSYAYQVPTLQVVGRCGCGRCPTIFFEKPLPGVSETDLSTYAGRDETEGLVAAVLLQSNGRLSQLEFYSIDGHDPWFAPRAEALAPYA